MPFINTKTNVKVSSEKVQELKGQLGESITLLGKSESWLMCSFTDNEMMFFKGNSDPCAMVQVDLYGNPSKSQCDSFTSKVTDIYSNELGIEPDRIYVRYLPTDLWGWNGSNF